MREVPIEVDADTAAESRSHRARVVQVWDLPLRIFHWALVIAIAAAYVTAEFGGSEWAHGHGRIGSFVLGLLVFRVVWGFIGTQHARFGSFLPTPARVATYLSGRWQRAGHNPLGALAVIALLSLVAAQVMTGLFANDDTAFAGPLSSWVGKSTGDWLTGWHQQIFYVLAGFIGLHILAILFYLLVRKSNLVAPMITGKQAVVIGEPLASVPQHLALRFVAAVLVAAMVAGPTLRDSSSTHAETVAPPVATADW